MPVSSFGRAVWGASVVAAWIVVSGCSPGAPTDAVTPRRPVVNKYHGVKVTDDYQWLEQATNPAVREWTAKQNARSRAYWDKLPVREHLADELEDLYEQSSANYFSMAYRTNLNFMLRFRPPQQQPVLIWMESISRRGRTRTVVDPNELNTNGTTTIDWYVPSRNGRLVAVSLSEKGSEDGSLHFFDSFKTNDNKLADMVPRVQYPTAGGSAAWDADGTGIFYTRFPAPGERPAADEHFYQQVYFHKLGTPVSEDRYEIGKEFPRIAEIELEASEDGKFILATVANGDGGDYYHWLRQTNGQWLQLTKFDDGVKHAAFGGDALYLLSRKNAPRGKVLRLALDGVGQGIAAAKEFVPEGEAVMESLAPSARGLYVKELVGGPSRIRYFDGQGKLVRNLEFKEPTAVQQMLVRRGEELTYRRVRFTEPYAWNTYDPRTNGPPVRTSLAGTSPVKFDDVEVVRESATSKDGTKVPINIIKRKSTKLDGSNPTVLYGYGGYGISLAPDFKVSRRLWLDAGGVYAIANLRGGGEFGEAWHKAGSLTNKQNVFDDFIACAEHLIEKRYTNPQKLAIQGGSNGGLLVGAALTQRPDLFRAVAAHVGIYDMLRVELEPNGAFNVTEFGTVTDREQFHALHAYSPFHRVTNGTAYPAVLLTTGENDGRVNPYNSRKMAARLQAATSSSTQPILLRTSASAGHGMGSALRDRIEEEADVLSFLIDQLGADIAAWWSKSPVERGPWSGAMTPMSATVKAKLRDKGASARLVLSRDVDFAGATRTPPQKADSGHGRVVAFELAGLEPDTTYHYAVEVNGELEKEKAGKFRTFPKAGSPASFTFAFASCGQTGSTNASYEMIRRHQPLFYFNDGDFHYQNIKVNNVKRFRRAYDRALGSPVQAALYRDVPFDYVWDDHDFGGDNANRKAGSHEAAGAAYREYVPHYPLPAGDAEVAVYHSFAVGRAKFIFTDLRSERDPADQKDDEQKSMMGRQQKEWFKKELLESNGRYPLIFWVSSVPWIGKAGTNYYRVSTNVFGYLHHTNITDRMRPGQREAEAEEDDENGDGPTEPATAQRPGSRATTNETSRASRSGGRGQRDEGRRRDRRPPRFPFGEDHWSVFSTERRELADFVKSNDIRGLAILHGDAHMLAADNGTYSDYATGGGAALPVMGAGPLDQNPSIKGGPYSQGVYRTRKGEGCFGLVTVVDEGKSIQVKFSGRNNRDEEKVSLEFRVPATGPNPEDTPSAAAR